MAPTPPLPVTEDTPPDMLAGAMDLRVVLPGGRAVKMSVERCTPMMDLLVHVATANKMAPGGFVLQPVGERGALPYKPSTPIGALDTWTVQIVPKARTQAPAPSAATPLRRPAPLKPNNQQPFEQTFRLQVHLPRNQLFVARVSPKCLLSDVLSLACTEKNLDPNKYELRHPANLDVLLRLECSLADYKLQEVTLVAKGNRPLGAGLSSSDIMALQKEEEKRRQQVKANGAGSAVLGLMLGKRSQSSVGEGSISSDSLGGRSISPSRSDETPSPPGSSLPPPRPTRKRRPAPKPPTQAPAPAPVPAATLTAPAQATGAVISHSRNSSDSSGYHEASILSESPESNGLSSPSGTLPRRSKLTAVTTTTTTAQVKNGSTNHALSRSLSNLNNVTNGDAQKNGSAVHPMRKNNHSASTNSLAGHGKRKKAPPPPPLLARNGAPEQLKADHRTSSLSTLSSQSSSDSYDRDMCLRTGTLERPGSSQSSTNSSLIRHETLPEEDPVLESNHSSPKMRHQERQNSLEPPVEWQSEILPKPVPVPKSKSSPEETNAQGNRNNAVMGSESSTEVSSAESTPAKHAAVPVPLSPKVEIRTNHEVKVPKAVVPQPVASVESPADASYYDHAARPLGSPRASLPDVVSAKATPPTPKPRVPPVAAARKLPPTPRPRQLLPRTNSPSPNTSLVNNSCDNKCANELDEQNKCANELDEQNKCANELDKQNKFVDELDKQNKCAKQLDEQNKCDSSYEEQKVLSRASSQLLQSRGSIASRFGVGKTMVLLAAERKDSVNSQSQKDTSETSSVLSSDQEMVTVFRDDKDEEDDALNMDEDDLEMFQVKSNSVDSTPADFVQQETASLYDSLSVASSVFDSEHETSDGTWGKSSGTSKKFIKHQHQVVRRSFQCESVKMRAASLQSMEDVPSFLSEGSRLGRWPSTEDLHAGSKSDQETDLQKETDEMEREFESVANELEASILAEEAKQAAPVPVPKADSPSPSPSLTDWEYQLPAPPSEFRDNMSPTFTQAETVDLTETPVFEEAPPEVLPPAQFIDADKSLIVEEEEQQSLSPLIRNYVKGITKVNPLYNDEQYEAEILEESRRSSNGSNSNEINKNEIKTSLNKNTKEEEDDWSPQQLMETAQIGASGNARAQNNVIRKQSFNSENIQANQLKNFTITSYQRPQDTDIIFKGETEPEKKEFEFKKPVDPPMYNRYRGSTNTLVPSNLPRTNSFSARDSQPSEQPSVKRSTSHISTVKTGRTIRAKSIGNLTLESSAERRDSRSSEEDDGLQQERGLRKTTSEVNISQGYERSSRLAELQDQFLQWQEQLLRQTQPDIPLQSLQVLRSILSPSQDGARMKAKEKKLLDDAASKSSTLPTQAEEKETIDTPDPTPVAPPKPEVVTLRRQSSSAASAANTAKRYSYQGPPAVNFATWSERPKSQVSIKVDNDYRIGKGQSSVSNKEAELMMENEVEINEKDRKDSLDQVDATQNSVPISEGPVPQSHHIKPMPLTMRIISHSTPMGYKRSNSVSVSTINKLEDMKPSAEKEPVVTHPVIARAHSYTSAHMADPSRVPIVRAVELKKSFVQAQQQRETTTTAAAEPERKPSTTSVKLSWNEMNNQNGPPKITTNGIHKEDEDAPEVFQGVNQLAKRFSLASSGSEKIKINRPLTRPTSAHFTSDSKEKFDFEIKRNNVNINGTKEVNDTNIVKNNTNNNQNSAKKYTSVVGINGAGVQNGHHDQGDSNRLPVKVASSTYSKSNGVLGPRHPMPVVKGFRFASNDFSDASLVASDSHKLSANTQPLTVKIQQNNNSTVTVNQRNAPADVTPSVSVRIQHQPVSKQSPAKVSVLAPVPPPVPPTLPKKSITQRPKSLPPPSANPRDELMDAIRSFGGRANLRQNGGS